MLTATKPRASGPAANLSFPITLVAPLSAFVNPPGLPSPPSGLKLTADNAKRAVAAELTHQLLHTEFENNDYSMMCAYDLEEVRALASDKKDSVLTMNSGVQGGFVTIAEARKTLGLDADDSHEVFLRPLNMVAVPVGETGVMTQNEESQQSSQEQSSEEDEKATLNTTRFQPEVRRSKRVTKNTRCP